MRTLKFAAACVFVLAMATEVSAQDFKVYPGATKFAYSAAEDTKKAIVSTSSGTTQTIYVSDDSFDKVATFYRGIAREYTMPYQQNDKKLSSGKELNEFYFILDGAKDLTASKYWVKIQRPFVGLIEMRAMAPVYHDIRDVTAIELFKKK